MKTDFAQHDDVHVLDPPDPIVSAPPTVIPTPESRPRYQFGSTPESAAAGEITLLAILETLLAAALAIVCIKVFHTATHIVIGALIAPFLLLRTEASTAKTFILFDSWFWKLTRIFPLIQRCSDRLPPALRALALLVAGLPLFS